MKLINMLILIMITLGITLPKGNYVSEILENAQTMTISEFIESHDDSKDDRSDDNDDIKKADSVEPYFIPNRYDFSRKVTSISFIDRLPAFTASYIPVFHVPPSR